MTSKKSKSALWNKTIGDLVHMNTARLTYKLWSLENTKPAFRSAKDKATFKEVKRILTKRATKFRQIISNKLSHKRKRPNEK